MENKRSSTRLPVVITEILISIIKNTTIKKKYLNEEKFKHATTEWRVSIK